MSTQDIGPATARAVDLQRRHTAEDIARFPRAQHLLHAAQSALPNRTNDHHA